MSINVTTTVGELAVTLPYAARVFEQFGIDYCCGGATPLIDACRISKAEVDKVLNAIAAAERNAHEEIDYSRLSLRELTSHIVARHHVFTRAEIARLTQLTSKVVSVHGSRHPELASGRKVFDGLAADLLPHLQKEEMVLFPYIVNVEAARETGTTLSRPPFVAVRNPIRMMGFEHDLAGELLRELRRLTSNYTVPPDACASYKTLYAALENFEQDLHQHIHLENNILFPRAVELESR
jgi:regulator of cell morphogenesis and NO signaling